MTVLKAQNRDVQKESSEMLRKQGKLACIMYGQGEEATPLKVSLHDFEKVYKEVGQSALVSVEIEGQKATVDVLIYKIQRDVLKDFIIHADLYKVDEKVPVKTTIPLYIDGISPAVKEKGGILQQQMSEVKIQALPKKLISEIRLDISTLKNFGDRITVGDVHLPEGVEILREPGDLIVSISAPRKMIIEEGAPVDVIPESAQEKPAAPAGGEEKKEENKE